MLKVYVFQLHVLNSVYIIYKLVSFSHVAKGGGGCRKHFYGNFQYIQLIKSKIPAGWVFLISCTPREDPRMDSMKSDLHLNYTKYSKNHSWIYLSAWKMSLYWKFQNGK